MIILLERHLILNTEYCCNRDVLTWRKPPQYESLARRIYSTLLPFRHLAMYVLHKEERKNRQNVVTIIDPDVRKWFEKRLLRS